MSSLLERFDTESERPNRFAAQGRQWGGILISGTVTRTGGPVKASGIDIAFPGTGEDAYIDELSQIRWPIFAT